MEIADGIERRLAKLVELLGSQGALAHAAGVSRPAVSGWLRGSVPYHTTLRRIIRATGCSEDWLLRAQGEPGMHRVMEEPGSYGARTQKAQGYSRTIAELSALLPDAGPSAREELLKRIQELIAEEQRK